MQLSHQSACLVCMELWVLSSALYKSAMPPDTYNPSSQELETGGLQVRDQLHLHWELKVSVGCLRPCLKRKRKAIYIWQPKASDDSGACSQQGCGSQPDCIKEWQSCFIAAAEDKEWEREFRTSYGGAHLSSRWLGSWSRSAVSSKSAWVTSCHHIQKSKHD